MKRITLIPLLILCAAQIASAQEWAKATLEKSPRHREWVTVKHDGRSVETLVIYPESKGKMTSVSTERPSCLTVTHSRCLGDFSRVALAHSCAEAICAAQRINKGIRVMRFMVSFLLQRTSL